MHIAFITSEYPHSQLNINVGGIGSFTKNIAEALYNKGNKVTIFLTSQESSKIINDDIKIHVIKQRKFIGFTWLTNRKHIQSYINKVSISEGIDIIEAPDWTGITAFMNFKVPLVIRLHGSDTFFCHLENRTQKRKNYYFEKRALFGASSIIGVSHFVSKKTKELFNIKKEIKVIYNAIDTNLFSKSNEEVIDNSILYIGTIIRKKGVLELAKIFNKAIEKKPSLILTLIGKDAIDVIENESTFELFTSLLTETAKEKINYLGSVPYDEVRGYIEKSQLIVLPSLAESFGLATIESMSMEKCVVTSDFDWNKEIIENNVSGVLISPFQHQIFADKINLLFADKKAIKEIEIKARNKIIECFNLEYIVEDNLRFYKDIINKI